MRKVDSVYIDHIQEALDKIGQYTDHVSKEEFLANSEKQDAVIRQLEIVGEATKRISSELREHNRQIPWSEMAGMRDKLIHDYIGVDIWIVWETVKTDVPSLKNLLKNIKEI